MNGPVTEEEIEIGSGGVIRCSVSPSSILFNRAWLDWTEDEGEREGDGGGPATGD